MEDFIHIKNLTVSFRTARGLLRAVDQVTLRLRSGEIFALVGESGCGKSTLAYSLLNLIPEPGFFETGGIVFQGIDIVQAKYRELRNLRGKLISMVFQASMNSFNPVLRFKNQVDHIFDAHPEVWPKRSEGYAYFSELLTLVRLSPDQVLKSFPHELSGGMKQRVAIAISLLLRPTMLILDEPTTALDVLNQRLVLDILRDLHSRLGLTVVFVTHDLGVVADIADRVGVMYAGKLVDVGTLEQVFYDPARHPYVTGLLHAAPSAFQAVRARPIPGSVPNLLELQPGCRFAPRCDLAESMCRVSEPELVVHSSGHVVSCHVMSRMEAKEVMVQ